MYCEGGGVTNVEENPDVWSQLIVKYHHSNGYHGDTPYKQLYNT